jgi:hypothetical protein
MRAAAIEMTVMCTGAPPHPGTEIYGARALDIFFPGGGMGADDDGLPSIRDILKVPVSTRVSSLANPAMLADALTGHFGPEPGGWPHDVLERMFAAINRDLLSGVKMNYNTPEALFALLTRCGGGSSRALAQLVKMREAADHPAIAALRRAFAERDLAGAGLTHSEFFDVFLGRVVSAPGTDVGRQLLAVFDVDNSGSINAAEAEWPLLWAVGLFPGECTTLDAALACILQRVALPALRRRLKLRRIGKSLRRVLLSMSLSQQGGAAAGTATPA